MVDVRPRYVTANGSNVPVLAVWGRGDPIFGPAGARACGQAAAPIDDFPDQRLA